MIAVRDAGRAYARSIVEHSQGVMEWITFVDGRHRGSTGKAQNGRDRVLGTA